MHFRDATIYNPTALNYSRVFLREATLRARFVSPIWNFMAMQRKGLYQKPTGFWKKAVATSVLHTSLLKPNIRQHFRAHKKSLKALLMGQRVLRTVPGECLSGLAEE